MTTPPMSPPRSIERTSTPVTVPLTDDPLLRRLSPPNISVSLDDMASPSRLEQPGNAPAAAASGGSLGQRLGAKAAGAAPARGGVFGRARRTQVAPSVTTDADESVAAMGGDEGGDDDEDEDDDDAMTTTDAGATQGSVRGRGSVLRPGAPTHLHMPHQHSAVDDEEEADEDVVSRWRRTIKPRAWSRTTADSRRPLSALGGARQRYLSPRGGPHRTDSPAGASMLRRGDDEGFAADDKPPIPAALPGKSDEYSTPLPTIPIIVLCIAMFSEFLSASLAGPFLYFMIEDMGVGQGPDGGGEATVGFWSGIVSSVFFLSQFLTSLLWVSAADRHGRRAVLFASLLGNAVFIALFGTCGNLASAICVRLGQGVFNGAVGVARSAVKDISDASNESRAFSYMGLAWGLGGLVGAIVGGVTEHPVENLSFLFADVKLFVSYPYLLPCLIAASVCLIGAFLCLFLNYDGGQREGTIRLPTEKDVGAAATGLGGVVKRTFAFMAACILRRKRPAIELTTEDDDEAADAAEAGESGLAPLSDGPRGPGYRRASRRSSAWSAARPPSSAAHRVGAGSAYGYDARRRTSRARGGSPTRSHLGTEYEDINPSDFTFPERLLLANEANVFNISDLWVAAATQNEDNYSVAHFEDADDEDEGEEADESRIEYDDTTEASYFPQSANPSVENLKERAARPLSRQADITQPSQSGGSPMRPPTSVLSPTSRRVSAGGVRRRRASTASSAMPAIFANTGLEPPSHNLLSPGPRDTSSPLPGGGPSPFSPMKTIPERQSASASASVATLPHLDNSHVADEKPPSIYAQMPLALIAQYALLAMHASTCDQVFMSFLVTPVPSGGLGLKAAHYALLVAMMVVCQMIWQFRFYPFIGPPRGTLSHLAMFRLGLALYLPVYFLFPELRGLLNEKHNVFVMFGMTILSAIRYLANTCAYTAVAVLINAMTPPHLVPFANGLAQCAVSLARFLGPVVGGVLWSQSIADGPTAHAYPFNYAFGFVVIAVLCLAGLIHSFWLR